MGIVLPLERRRVRLDIFRLLGLLCLLFVAAEVASAQSDPTVRVDDCVVYEGNSTETVFFVCVFKISLSAPSSKPVSVTLTTQSGTAISPADFEPGTVVLNFQPGHTTSILQILIQHDTIVEGTESFFVNVSNPVNATIANSQARGDIVDDDALALVTQPASQRAVAVDSVFHSKESFPINNSNFGPEARTRISLFSVGLKLAPGEGAAAVTATAEDSQGAVQPLTVEFVGNLPNPEFNWITQVVVRLNDQPTTGDLKIKISLHGQMSNTVLAAVRPQ